ncbi:MAG: LytR C-terminal domain-containing protein, partial [Actinomycetota bacterium]
VGGSYRGYGQNLVIERGVVNFQGALDAPGLIPADVNVSEINVGVYNGTFEEGVASEAAEQLEEAMKVGSGTIDVVAVTNADKINYKRTIIRFDPNNEGAEEKAEIVARAVPNATVEEGETNFGVDVALIVGKERAEFMKLVQIVPIEIPEPSEVPPACR